MNTTPKITEKKKNSIRFRLSLWLSNERKGHPVHGHFEYWKWLSKYDGKSFPL